MTDAQIRLVKSSWKVLRQIDPLLIGDVFYSKLFVAYPKLESLFTSSRESQSAKLIDTLSMLVSGLDDTPALEEELSQLAIRHIRYGVKHVDYDAVGEALLWTIRQALGSDWNEEMGLAWTACYNMIAATMIAATAENNSDHGIK